MKNRAIAQWQMQRQGLDHLVGTPMKGLDHLGETILKLESVSPEVSKFMTGMQRYQKSLEVDKDVFDKITSQFPEGTFQKVASLPYSVNQLILQEYPDMLQDEKAIEKFLGSEVGRPYDRRRRSQRVSIRGGF